MPTGRPSKRAFPRPFGVFGSGAITIRRHEGVSSRPPGAASRDVHPPRGGPVDPARPHRPLRFRRRRRRHEPAGATGRAGPPPTGRPPRFGVTAAGSIFFSWIYVESENNLWSVIWLHTLMNLPWIVFRVSTSGAVGDIGANALRLCTIILAIGLTVAYKRKRGLPTEYRSIH